MSESIITLLTESHGGIVHEVILSLGRGFEPHSDGLTRSLFCLHEITVTRWPVPHDTEH